MAPASSPGWSFYAPWWLLPSCQVGKSDPDRGYFGGCWDLDVSKCWNDGSIPCFYGYIQGLQTSWDFHRLKGLHYFMVFTWDCLGARLGVSPAKLKQRDASFVYIYIVILYLFVCTRNYRYTMYMQFLSFYLLKGDCIVAVDISTHLFEMNSAGDHIHIPTLEEYI